MRVSTLRPAVLIIAGILGSTAVSTAVARHAVRRTAPTPRLEWRFDTREGTDSTPHTSLYLLVNGHPHEIAANAEESFYSLDPGTYDTDGIPSTAMVACQGWWAGEGDDYYVVRRNNDLLVYDQGVDESKTGPAGARTLAKTIPLIAHHRLRRPRTWRKAGVTVVPHHVVHLVPRPHGVEDSVILNGAAGSTPAR